TNCQHRQHILTHLKANAPILVNRIVSLLFQKQVLPAPFRRAPRSRRTARPEGIARSPCELQECPKDRGQSRLPSPPQDPPPRPAPPSRPTTPRLTCRSARRTPATWPPTCPCPAISTTRWPSSSPSPAALPIGRTAATAWAPSTRRSAPFRRPAATSSSRPAVRVPPSSQRPARTFRSSPPPTRT